MGGAGTGGAGTGGAGMGGAGPRLLRALLLLPGLCVAFNVDVRDPQLFLGPPEAQFGYKVLQRVDGGEKWLLVAAPWDGDGQGDVYKCRVGPPNATCDKANLGSTTPLLSPPHRGHLGMTLLDSEDGGFVACAPLWSQTCGTSVFSTGACARLDGDLRAVGTMAPTAQRCSTYMDIVIVLDGSNSIYPWVEVQNFLSNVLSRFFIGPGQIQVGVLQYGEHAVHEWALGRYRSAQEVVEAARNISRQEGRETRTAMAVRTACTEAFSAERGGRADATRLMIVVTDGESHDGEELPGALAECDRRNVTRYAIAVLGHYLRRQQDPEDFIREIKFIASDPDEKYFFNVTDEAALNDIVDALGDRIFSLEGTPGHNASSFELEMSQIGFSVHPLEIGSYFGSEVCPLDVDGDGVTDVLLVAAPMYLGAQGRETGRVYLYRVGQDTSDYLRPLGVTVTLAMAEDTGPVLDEASPTTIRKLVSFTLELEFSCSVLLDRAEVTLEATSDGTEVTPEDNVVRLSVPIRYEPELFLASDATLRRYEVQPPGTFPHGPGPEFKTTVTVQNLGCYPVRNVTLRMALPALGFGRVPFLSVTRVLADNLGFFTRKKLPEEEEEEEEQ
ncbi:hypothetical protein Q9966_004617 [Columba livia]|nr:hypothetical protein Q9966_004617 [Columba livia]